MAPKFKPGGKKFPRKSVSKPLPPQISSLVATSDSPTSSGLDEEAENKFELELCWCIQKLELSVNSGNLSEKQIKGTQKNLDLLKSNSIPLIQKRQIMRNTFGDYRAKMLEEEKKHGKTASTVKFSTPKSGGNKSTFIRKAHTTPSDINQSLTNQCDDNCIAESNGSSGPKLSSLFNKNTSSEPFTFNFSQSAA